MTYVYDVTITRSATTETEVSVPSSLDVLNKWTAKGISQANITTAITNMMSMLVGEVIESIVVTKRAVIS